jgi:hypothetical protein
VSRENCVFSDRGECKNRNTASLVGLKTGVDALHITGNLYGDTVRVYIDFSGIDAEKSSQAGGNISRVINLTFDAVVATAYKSRRGIDSETKEAIYAKYVDIEVRGPDEYKDLARVVSFDTWLATRRAR